MIDGRPADAAPLLTEALALFRGRPLQGFDDVMFVADEARRLAEMSGSPSRRTSPRSTSTWASTPKLRSGSTAWWPSARCGNVWWPR